LVVPATVLNGRVEQVGNREGKEFMKEADGPEGADATPVRCFLCARCHAQVLICSCCDRGQIY
jgi:hypothetical protein